MEVKVLKKSVVLTIRAGKKIFCLFYVVSYIKYLIGQANLIISPEQAT